MAPGHRPWPTNLGPGGGDGVEAARQRGDPKDAVRLQVSDWVYLSRHRTPSGWLHTDRSSPRSARCGKGGCSSARHSSPPAAIGQPHHKHRFGKRRRQSAGHSSREQGAKRSSGRRPRGSSALMLIAATTHRRSDYDRQPRHRGQGRPGRPGCCGSGVPALVRLLHQAITCPTMFVSFGSWLRCRSTPGCCCRPLVFLVGAA